MINIRDEALLIEFGKRVRQLRLEKGLTIEQLAAMANIEYRQLSDVERGKTNPTLSTIKVIAFALDLKMSALFDFEE